MRAIPVLALAAICCAVSAQKAQAMPMFSKKYAIPCSACHSAWPKLNDTGAKFKINGYQLPGSQDGGEVGKIPMSDSLFLDSGPANPPASLIMYGGGALIQPNQGYYGKQEGKFFCCVHGNDLNLEVAGTATANIGYRISAKWGEENISQGYLRYTNLFSPGFLALDLGLMNVVDYDSVSDKDSWFEVPIPAYWGWTSTHPMTGPVGLGAHVSDTGGRLYGRPGYGTFSYEIGVFTGGGLAKRTEDDNAQAYTLMGRVDTGPISFSVRHWGNKSAWLNHEATLPSGETVNFKADHSLLDEKTDHIILSARYSDPMFILDLAVDRLTYNLNSPRTALSSGGTEHTLEQSPLTRMGMTANFTYIFNQWMEGAIAYSVINIEEYTRTLDGSPTVREAYSSSLAQVRFTFSPAINTRLAIEAQVDMTHEKYRIAPGQEEPFPGQNKLIFQWQLAL